MILWFARARRACKESATAVRPHSAHGRRGHELLVLGKLQRDRPHLASGRSFEDAKETVLTAVEKSGLLYRMQAGAAILRAHVA